VYIYFNK